MMTTNEIRPQASGPGPTVLIVDDEASIRTLLKKIVLDLAPTARVEEAADGESALRLAQTLHPDLVLLDIVLPGSETSGVLVCQELCRRHAQVLIVSGNASGSILDACLAVGAAAVLRKPFTLESAREKISACLGI
jgi:CheY-like chemotaxis protein